MQQLNYSNYLNVKNGVAYIKRDALVLFVLDKRHNKRIAVFIERQMQFV